MSKLVVNKESCMGCGCCEATCEAVFKLDDDGKACVKDAGKVEENKNELIDASLIAARRCCPSTIKPGLSL